MNRFDDAARELLTEVPPPPTVERLRSRIRRSRRRRVAGIVVVVAMISVLTVGVAASVGRETSAPCIAVRPGTGTTSSVPHSERGAALSFRKVLGVVPYGSSTAPTVAPGPRGSTSCEGGRLVTADQPRNTVVLANRQKSSCYALGPTLLTQTSVLSADPEFDEQSGAWDVDVVFANDDFVKDVASVYVGKQVAIVVDGVVEAAPTINAGITGRAVTIEGAFDESTARNIAARLNPSGAAIPPATTTTV